MTQDDTDEILRDDPWYAGTWAPCEYAGWTWVQTQSGAPEGYSLFDADGELMGHAYNRFNRVICWAPFVWAEEAYRSTEDVDEWGFEDDEQRRRHLVKIGSALSDWAKRKRDAGVDIALLRDTHAYYFETRNGHAPETLAEWEYPTHYFDPDSGLRSANREAPLAFSVDGWAVEPATCWHCEGYRLRDETGQLRGDLQVRLGVVRAVAARPEDAEPLDPTRNPDYSPFGQGKRTCRGQIVLQERLRPMALRFEPGERDSWIRRAIAAVRATPDPDRTWPPETLGAKGTPGQRMFPASPRDWV